MKRVRFIVTGDLEWAAIVPSISRLFPSQTFEGEDVEWLQPRKVHGATGNRLRPNQEPDRAMRGLARALLAEAWEGADGTPADLVIAVDDVELNNFDQRQLICEHFRVALEREIEARDRDQQTTQRIRDRVRERCSFHLLCPMVEGYFFADRSALRLAGCAANVAPRLSHADVEEFECCDADWLPGCIAENQRKAAMPIPMPWWREERHAKHYLEYLVERDGGHYDEVLGGKAGFAALAWHRAAANGGSDVAGPGHAGRHGRLFRDLQSRGWPGAVFAHLPEPAS
ncbi:hypothetical protein [Enhygromyxa salina]|uniref:Uncharacterized protein n=1 Tax=Enhygromyxa salina TaxID=215803 RepID=A0A2S9YQZ7_9BACT|nr:hypothetical protein [Enhygromyxa salina]PRQ07517.1 hypothetical protein ENSA7_27370 [Enhygromyxa salina]